MALNKPRKGSKMKRSANPDKVTSKGKKNPKGGVFGAKRRRKK